MTHYTLSSNGCFLDITSHIIIAWCLRYRILYEIALGVNYLHNMNPPLLHHDLKTQNILLDDEFHVKIADFGMSKWRVISMSQSRSETSLPEGGTIVYMPPEDYCFQDSYFIKRFSGLVQGLLNILGMMVFHLGFAPIHFLSIL